ncbi:hypothetical protein QLQ80_01035, partial [Mycoplasma sp. M5725]
MLKFTKLLSLPILLLPTLTSCGIFKTIQEEAKISEEEKKNANWETQITKNIVSLNLNKNQDFDNLKFFEQLKNTKNNNEIISLIQNNLFFSFVTERINHVTHFHTGYDIKDSWDKNSASDLNKYLNGVYLYILNITGSGKNGSGVIKNDNEIIIQYQLGSNYRGNTKEERKNGPFYLYNGQLTVTKNSII